MLSFQKIFPSVLEKVLNRNDVVFTTNYNSEIKKFIWNPGASGRKIKKQEKDFKTTK